MIITDVCEHCGSLACLLANAIECRHTRQRRSQASDPTPRKRASKVKV